MAPRIALVIHSLGSGGAERVLTALANAWAARGWSVSLVTLDAGAEPPFYALHPAVARHPLGVAGASTSFASAAASNARRVRALRSALRGWRPDVVLAFMVTSNVLTLLATRGTGWPVIVSERVDPARHRIRRSWSWLRRLTYPWASRIVVQTVAAEKFFGGRARRRTCVIPNAVAPPPPPAASTGRAAPPRIVALGRLTPQKGFDLLLHAFARVAAEHADWSLEIWGEGEERARLEALAAALGLAGRARLPGLTAAPYEVLRGAAMFVLSSRFEGFPNALCEAMACGVAVISFDCPSGPADCVRDGLDGLLVPPGDVAALAAAMARLMADPAERSRLGARAREITERFGTPRVMAAWDALFGELGVRG